MPAVTSPSTTAGRTRGVQAVQIEINRARYLNEMTFVRAPGFERLQRDLTQHRRITCSRLTARRSIGPPQRNSQPADPLLRRRIKTEPSKAGIEKGPPEWTAQV